MKITIIYGSPRKGSSYRAAQIFKEEMLKNGEIEFSEFFLPKDLPEFCCGCMACFTYGRDKCPHCQYTLPILDSMLKSDAFIFTTPVFVLQTSGSMKNFLDHFGHIFLVHRAEELMFSKKAFILSTTAGAGTKAAIKTIKTNLKYWGINRTYSSGFALHEVDWHNMKLKRKNKFETKIQKNASKFYKEVAGGKKHKPYLTTKIMFNLMRGMIKKYNDDSLDKQYWQEKNWFKTTPFK